MANTQSLHRGRLIDHLQLVVKDLEASRKFYAAVLASLNIPMGASEKEYFWADELFVSNVESERHKGS
jgi:catechol 2,3-dioxygenase-like lactoylglutathione lyase family enzyme